MTQFQDKKTAPHNIFAEKIILGHIILNPNSAVFIFDKLPLEAFYSDINKVVYKTTYSLYSKKEPINYITISDELTSLNLLNFIGGNDFLFEICNQELIIEDLEMYISLILDKYLRRHIFNTGSKICTLAYNQSYSSDYIIDHTQKMISSIKYGKTNLNLLTASEVLLETFLQLEKKTKQAENSGIYSGFFDLDYLTSGFQKGDLIILAGRPSMGKTALALNLVKNISETQIFPVVIFSLEMSRQQIIYRFIASEAQLSSNKLKAGKISASEWHIVNKAISYLANLKIYLDDNLSTSLTDIKLKLMQLKSKSGHIGAIVIDYLQLLSENNQKETRNQELSKITRGLKIIAKELDAPVIVLSQLSRNLEFRQNKKPILSDLRESGCVSGNNKIYSIYEDKFLTINCLRINRHKDIFLSKKKHSLSLVFNYCKKTITTGYKNYFIIKTFGNYEIELTSEHKVFTIKGWVQIKKIQKNDYIGIFDKYNFPKICMSISNKIVFSEVFFSVLESKKYKSENYVYDLWFPYTKNFICNNIVVHNSIEQDADVVLMLYRKDYYSHSKKNANVSELILAKQRNGPIDTIKLIFDPKIVTFSNFVCIS